MTQELAKDNGISVEVEGYNREIREASGDLLARRAEQRFAGGLADKSIAPVRMHTATAPAPFRVTPCLGTHVHQRGSNITPGAPPLRLLARGEDDPEQVKEMEKLVNEQIANGAQVSFVEMPVKEALENGVIGDLKSDTAT